MADDPEIEIMTAEDAQEEQIVWMQLFWGSIGVLLLIAAFTYRPVYTGYISFKTFVVLTITLFLSIESPILGKLCTIRLGFNDVAFVYNPFTKATRVLVGKFRWKLPWEDVNIINLNFNHIVKNDPEMILTEDQINVEVDAILLMIADQKNLLTYNKFDNDVINKAAAAEFNTLLKSYVSSSQSQAIQPTKKDLGTKKEDPFEEAFQAYPWEAFEKKYGVECKAAKISTVKFPQEVTDAANRVQATKSFNQTFKDLKLGKDNVSDAQILQIAEMLWNRNERQFIVTPGIGGNPNQNNQGGKQGKKRRN